MLNRVILMGRITQDLDLRQTPSGVSTLSFSVAVDRNYVKQGEERQTDFITCVAWRQTAEFISRYFSKGRMIAVEGSLRTRNYEDKNGTRHYVTEVYVDNVSFTGESRQQGGQSSYGGNSYNNNYGGSQDQGGQRQHSGNGYSNNAAPAKDSIAIGDFEDFEEVLSDDGVPF